MASKGRWLLPPSAGSQQGMSLTELVEVGGATSAALGRGAVTGPTQQAAITVASAGEVCGLTRQLERYDGPITGCMLHRGTTANAFTNGVWLQEAVAPTAAPLLLPAGYPGRVRLACDVQGEQGRVDPRFVCSSERVPQRRREGDSGGPPRALRAVGVQGD